MSASWYERQGPATEVLRVGELPRQAPAAHVAASAEPVGLTIRYGSLGTRVNFPVDAERQAAR